MTLLLQPAVPPVAGLPANPIEGQLAVLHPAATLPQLWRYSGGAWASVSKTIQDEGVSLPQRATLNVVGKSVDATDDAANSRTQLKVFDPIALATSNAGNGGSWGTGWSNTGLSISFTPDRQVAVWMTYSVRTDTNYSGWSYIGFRVICTQANDYDQVGNDLVFGIVNGIPYWMHNGSSLAICRAGVAQTVVVQAAAQVNGAWQFVNAGVVNFLNLLIVPYGTSF